ncbi:protein serine/threonine kinase [Pelomyxa schiedti]|nr:protein serine/threonine kinase [Pelomyxa schiedti]
MGNHATHGTEDEISRYVEASAAQGADSIEALRSSARDKRHSLPTKLYNRQEWAEALRQEAEANSVPPQTSASTTTPEDPHRKRSNTVLHPHIHIHLRRKSDAVPLNFKDGINTVATPKNLGSPSSNSTSSPAATTPTQLTPQPNADSTQPSPSPLPPSLLLRERAGTVGANRRSWRMSLPYAFTSSPVASSTTQATQSGSPSAVHSQTLKMPSPLQSNITMEEPSPLRPGEEETNTNSTNGGSHSDQICPVSLNAGTVSESAGRGPSSCTTTSHTPLHGKPRKTSALAVSADVVELSDSPTRPASNTNESNLPSSGNVPTQEDTSRSKDYSETPKTPSNFDFAQKSRHTRRHSEFSPTLHSLLSEPTISPGGKSSAPSNQPNAQLASPAPISLKRYSKRDAPPPSETCADPPGEEPSKETHHHSHGHRPSSSHHRKTAAAAEEAPKKITTIKKVPQKVIPFGETQPRRLATGKKNPTNLTLIQLHFLDAGTETCWTMAIDHTCTASDLCDRFSEFDTCEDASERSYRLFIMDGQADPSCPITPESIESSACQVETDVVLQTLVNGMEKTKKLYILVDNTIGAKRTDKVSLTSTAILIDNPSEKTSWIPEEQIKYISKISSGTFAKVYKAKYAGKIVAVKVLKSTCLDGKVIDEFKKECAILRSINHPNLVAFFGACVESRLCMVMEMCHRGTLVHLMSEPDVQFTWARVVEFSQQAFSGLEFLHKREPAIMHRDLKSLNLLVTKKLIVKVADFGLSRFQTSTNKSTLGRLVGTMNYCAPELYQGTSFTTASDVYSMGIIMWELVERLLSGKYAVPFAEYVYIHFDFQILVQASEKNLRPTINTRCPEPFAELIRACWSPQPAKRPSATQCIQQLEEFRILCSTW